MNSLSTFILSTLKFLNSLGEAVRFRIVIFTDFSVVHLLVSLALPTIPPFRQTFKQLQFHQRGSFASFTSYFRYERDFFLLKEA